MEADLFKLGQAHNSDTDSQLSFLRQVFDMFCKFGEGLIRWVARLPGGGAGGTKVAKPALLFCM